MPTEPRNDDLVMGLVEQALSQAAEHREAYLRSACSKDPGLFEQVWNYVKWEERMNGFLLNPLYPPPCNEHAFEPGQLLHGRFRIVREVAQGGMGVVYEAMDERLDRRIAIKCAKSGYHKRLPPEVRHASEISHPNVCKTFEIHTALTDEGEIDFLTMEFVEGQTLAERLRDGALRPQEAETVARQLCEGLAEAHRRQVVHGDLKTNNIILAQTAEGIRAVITDFGLARQPSSQQPAVQSGELGGAPDYMAPELLRGEKPSVASDIYALGVILYELASGRRPFGVECTWEERLEVQPAPLKHRWRHTVARCLEPDPSRRWVSVRDVARTLSPPVSRRVWGIAAAVAIVALGMGILGYERAGNTKENVRLAVTPAESAQDLAPLAHALTGDTGNQLARLTGGPHVSLIVIPPNKLLPRHVQTAAEAKALFGATHLLQTGLAREGNRLVVHASLTNAATLAKVREWQMEYSQQDLRYAPVALAGFVTGTLRLPPLAMNAIVNEAASQDYKRGMQQIRRNSTLDGAIPLLEQAVVEDPASPLTYAGLAEAEWLEYYASRDPNWLDRCRDAARQAEARNPDLAATHRIEGYLDYAGGLYQQAAAEYLRAVEIEPKNAITYVWLSKAYEDNHQFDEALTALQTAAALEPDYFRPYQGLGAFYLQRSKFEEAAKYHKKAVDLVPDEPNLRYGLAMAYVDLGKFAEAERELRYSVELQESLSAVHTLGVTLMYQGKDLEAIPWFKRALSLNSPSRGSRKYLPLMYLGIAYRRLGQPLAATAVNRQGLELAQAELVNPRDGYLLAFVAYFDAVLGDRRRAESEMTQALGLADDADTRWRAVLTYEALGLREKTLALLSTSTAEQLADVNRWPDLQGLREDSHFVQLLATHQIKN